MNSTAMISIAFLIITGMTKSVDHRKEEFSRIKKYELIQFETTSIHNDQILEFDAFDHHYIIELIPNVHMIPSNIKHTNRIPSTEDDDYYKLSNKSCHYYGKVLNTDDPLQRVSLSFCDNRGIRGEIRAFDETLIIKPSKYYLDIEYDNKGKHKLDDEHLVWRHSDFDSSDLPSLKQMEISHRENIKSTVPALIKNRNNHRRLLDNKNQVELLVLSCPTQTKYYQSLYNVHWYGQLYYDMADFVNAVSSKYQAVNFPPDIGIISIHFRELEVIYNFDGKYAILTPDYIDPSCTDWTNSECEIDGSGWNGKVAKYAKTKDQSTFDNVQMITKFSIQAGGWGYVGFICQENYNAATIQNNFGETFLANAAAHEMGHNFGANHDGPGTDCPFGQGLMGGSADGFSSCSIDSFEEYFKKDGGLYYQCLLNDPRTFISNVEKYFVGPQTNWDDANTYCELQGGQLAAIHSFEDFISAKTICTRDGGWNCWIGMSLNSVDGVYEWIDDSKTDYGFTNNDASQPTTGVYPWGDLTNPQPDNYNNQEHCIQLWYYQDYRFNDALCTQGSYALCQRYSSVPKKICAEDIDRHASCAYWASIGECDKNPGYMLGNCQTSCDICNDG